MIVPAFRGKCYRRAGIPGAFSIIRLGDDRGDGGHRKNNPHPPHQSPALAAAPARAAGCGRPCQNDTAIDAITIQTSA